MPLFPNRYYIFARYPGTVYKLFLRTHWTSEPGIEQHTIWRVDDEDQAKRLTEELSHQFCGMNWPELEFDYVPAKWWSERDQTQTELCLDKREEQLERIADGLPLRDCTHDSDWPVFKVTEYAIRYARVLERAANALPAPHLSSVDADESQTGDVPSIATTTEGEWSSPMPMAEMARRITCKDNARGREVEGMLKRHGLRRQSTGKWIVRLDTMDKRTRQKLESE